LAPQQELGLWPQWRDRLDIGNRIDSPIAGRDIAAISDGAEVVGGWANAAHLKNPLPFPTRVAIDVHELRPVRGSV
jgi:hypothetical protein